MSDTTPPSQPEHRSLAAQRGGADPGSADSTDTADAARDQQATPGADLLGLLDTVTAGTADGSSTGPVGLGDADTDLSEALDGLARLAIADRSLESSLTWIATLAVLAIPGAEGAGLTMFEAGHPQTVCVSHEFVRKVDDVQYTLGEGPCVTAAAEASTVVSGSLPSDPRWPRFGPRMREFGVRSAVSLPLVMAGGEVMGAMNVYAHDLDVFTVDAAGHGEVFATAAAVVVHNARGLMQAQRVAEQLRTALTSRATIDQAIGIVMSRQGSTSDDAFATLKRLSQTQNVKLAVVAERIVREAVLRARARHAGGSGGT